MKSKIKHSDSKIIKFANRDFSNLFNNQQYSDCRITFKIVESDKYLDAKIYFVHRILFDDSKYFKKVMDGKTSEVIIDTNKKLFDIYDKIIKEFFYSRQIILNINNVLDITTISSLIECEILYNKCIEYIKSQMNHKSIFIIIKSIYECTNERIQNSLELAILTFLNDWCFFFKPSEFMQLSTKLFDKFVNDENTQFTNEIKYIIGKTYYGKNLDKLFNLIKKIDLRYVTPKFLPLLTNDMYNRTKNEKGSVELKWCIDKIIQYKCLEVGTGNGNNYNIVELPVSGKGIFNYYNKYYGETCLFSAEIISKEVVTNTPLMNENITFKIATIITKINIELLGIGFFLDSDVIDNTDTLNISYKYIDLPQDGTKPVVVEQNFEQMNVNIVNAGIKKGPYWIVLMPSDTYTFSCFEMKNMNHQFKKMYLRMVYNSMNDIKREIKIHGFEIFGIIKNE